MFTEISQSKIKDIAQAKSSKSNGDETQTKKQINEKKQPTRFPEQFVKHSNDQDDDIAGSKTEYKYCKHAWGYSELYEICGYLRRYQGKKVAEIFIK